MKQVLIYQEQPKKKKHKKERLCRKCGADISNRHNRCICCESCQKERDKKRKQQDNRRNYVKNHPRTVIVKSKKERIGGLPVTKCKGLTKKEKDPMRPNFDNPDEMTHKNWITPSDFYYYDVDDEGEYSTNLKISKERIEEYEKKFAVLEKDSNDDKEDIYMSYYEPEKLKEKEFEKEQERQRKIEELSKKQRKTLDPWRKQISDKSIRKQAKHIRKFSKRKKISKRTEKLGV